MQGNGYKHSRRRISHLLEKNLTTKIIERLIYQVMNPGFLIFKSDIQLSFFFNIIEVVIQSFNI